MPDDNRLPTNQSQLDIAAALNGIASALTPQNTVNADSIYPVETSPSTHAYNEGDHLIVSGVTYVAIDDIAIGDSLVLNTNIQAETLATRMNHIEDGIETAQNTAESCAIRYLSEFTKSSSETIGSYPTDKSFFVNVIGGAGSDPYVTAFVDSRYRLNKRVYLDSTHYVYFNTNGAFDAGALTDGSKVIIFTLG